MSAKVIGKVWDLKLPHNKLIVLLAMADHADHEGNNVYPSVGLVAWKTGYSERSVRRIVKSLVEDGILICVEDAPGLVKKYRIDVSKGTKKEPYRSDDTPDTAMSPPTPDKTSEVEVVTPDTAMSPPPLTQLCHPTPDTAMSPKPSVKPSVKPNSSELLDDNKVIQLEPSNDEQPDKPDSSDNTDTPDKPKKKQEVLGDAFGVQPVTGQDWGLYGKVCKQLTEAGIEPSEYPDYIAWVRKLAKGTGGWKVTIPSLISGGRVSDYVSTKKQAQEKTTTSLPTTTDGERELYRILMQSQKDKSA